MNFRAHVTRLGAVLAGLGIILTANPAAASESIPDGYVKNYPSWCDWESQKADDIQLSTNNGTGTNVPAFLHFRQRSDGYLCAWVSINEPGWAGWAWKAIKIRHQDWTTPAYWGYSTTNNVSAALGTLNDSCMYAYAEVGTFAGYPASSTGTEPWMFCHF